MTTQGPFPFFHPARGVDPNPAAHGGVSWIDQRHDGSYRMRNTNGAHEEIGPWFAPTSDDEVDDELSEEAESLLGRIRSSGWRGVVIYSDDLEDAEELESRGLVSLGEPPDFSRGLALAVVS